MGRGAEQSPECVSGKVGLGSESAAVLGKDFRARSQVPEAELYGPILYVAPDPVSLLSHCRYNSQKLTELILQFYGIRADMKRESKHARLSMKVFITGGELDSLVDSPQVTVNQST